VTAKIKTRFNLLRSSPMFTMEEGMEQVLRHDQDLDESIMDLWVTQVRIFGQISKKYKEKTEKLTLFRLRKSESRTQGNPRCKFTLFLDWSLYFLYIDVLRCICRLSNSRSEDSSLDEMDIDLLEDANREKDIFRTKSRIYLSDLSRKSNRVLTKKANLYSWNLMTIATFYGLPVVQLVFTYQNVTNSTGNQVWFDQHLMHAFFVWKCLLQLFFAYILALIFFLNEVRRKILLNMFVKYWWNWQQVWLDHNNISFWTFLTFYDCMDWKAIE